MQQFKVHIVTSDSGWILERLAAEISKKLDYVTYSTEPDETAQVQYYITYGCRSRRVSPIEVALFTHRESDPAAAERFDQAARDVDVAISMSRTTHDIVQGLGVADSICISPGVDLNLFKPLIRVGVVGRTYHTGRKGEALVRAVMDVPGIEWHFTGEGWPGPARNIDQDKLPDFYRSMDYVLALLWQISRNWVPEGFVTVGASGSRWLHEEVENCLPDGWHGRLRRRSTDSFFSVPLP